MNRKIRIMLVKSKRIIKKQREPKISKGRHTIKRKHRLQKYKRSVSPGDSQQHGYLHWNQPAFWWNTLLAIFLSCAGGFFSGITVGLNSLDKLTLQVQQITGDKQQKQVASRILNTIKDHHLFLVTLLIGNAMVLESLPLVVHKIMPDWAAILTSTLAVVIVAEIVPMSYTTGPKKYQIAYIGAPLVDICIKFYYLIAYPIARGLDALLGVHDTSKISRRDFLALVNEKKKNQMKPLEITIFNQLFIGPKSISAQQLAVSLEHLFILSLEDQITQQTISNIVDQDVDFVFVTRNKKDKHNFHLTTPIKTKNLVYSYLKKRQQPQNIILKLNQLITLDHIIDSKTNKQSMKDLHSKQNIDNSIKTHKIPLVYSDTGLLDLLNILNQNKCSIAFVHKALRHDQNTNIAHLHSIDYEVLSSPSGLKDSKCIIGAVFLDNILEEIVDFKGELTSLIQLSRMESPPKKRRLVKKASIMSSYSHDD